MIDALQPEPSQLSPPAALQLQLNLEANRRLEEEFGLLTAAQVAERSGSTAANASQTGSRWRKAGKVLVFSVKGTSCYPGFQFDENGQPLPVIAEVIERLGPYLPSRQLAFWFVGASVDLYDGRPVDLFDEHPDDVIRVADELAADLLDAAGGVAPVSRSGVSTNP